MLHFYSERLGLKVIREWGDAADTGAILGLPDADANGYLEIAAVSKARSSAGVRLQFRTNDLHRAIEEFSGKVEHSLPEVKPWGSTYIYLFDPAGNEVIVFEGDI